MFYSVQVNSNPCEHVCIVFMRKLFYVLRYTPQFRWYVCKPRTRYEQRSPINAWCSRVTLHSCNFTGARHIIMPFLCSTIHYNGSNKKQGTNITWRGILELLKKAVLLLHSVHYTGNSQTGWSRGLSFHVKFIVYVVSMVLLAFRAWDAQLHIAFRYVVSSLHLSLQGMYGIT